jgi:serine/threonine protein kinase
VLINHERSAVLADFGLTQLEDCTLGGHSFYTSSCSPRWTSPQRLQGDHTKKVDDIYSLACVAYYVLRLGSTFA